MGQYFMDEKFRKDMAVQLVLGEQLLEWLGLKDSLLRWYLHSCVCCFGALWHISLLTGYQPVYLELGAGYSQGSHTCYMAVGSQEARVEATRSGKSHIQNWHNIIPISFYWTKNHKLAQVEDNEKQILPIDRGRGSGHSEEQHT